MKLKSKKFSSNNEFLNFLMTKTSPAISYKIYWEYAKSIECNQSYHIESHKDNDQLIQVHSTVKPDVKYTINIMENHCNCYKQLYLGIPCHHIFAVWRHFSKNLENEALKTIHTTWRIDLKNPELISDTRSKNTIKEQGILSKCKLSKNKSSTLNLAEPNHTSTSTNSNFDQNRKSEKNLSELILSGKRKSDQSTTTAATPGQKNTKMNDNIDQNRVESFPFVNFKANSCRFDSLLAFMKFFIESEGDLIFKSKAKGSESFAKTLLLISKLNSRNLKSTQTCFIELLHSNFESPTQIKDDYGDLVQLLKKIFEKDIAAFNTVFQRTSICTLKKCPDNSDKESVVFGPFCGANITEFREDIPGVVANWFHQSYIAVKTQSICQKCIDVAKNKNQKKIPNNIITISNTLIKLPEYLNINLESFITNNEYNIATIGADYIIEEKITLIHEGKKVTYSLLSVFLFENKNHYTLYFKDPTFSGKVYEGWFYYDDLNGMVVNMSKLPTLKDFLRQIKVPVILIYKMNK